jgi:hypothetical protein
MAETKSQSPKSDAAEQKLAGQRKEPRNKDGRPKGAAEPEPLDEESLEKVMRETPL